VFCSGLKVVTTNFFIAFTKTKTCQVHKRLCLPLPMKQAFAVILTISAFVFAMLGHSGCASIIPPEGGPRDTIPPQLVDADPDDSTTNFRGRRITLTFDEFVDLQDLSNNVLFTPVFETDPEIRVRLRTITINLKDTLEPNTTYRLNFGNAIRDLNEGNVSRNFTYTFTTGAAMDSLQFGGRVLLAESGRIDTTLMVALYRNLNDSAVLRERPRYITRLDARGNFLFTNLPAGTFKVYAFGGQGRLRNFREDQLFAFYNDSITVGTTDSILLYAYRERPPAAGPQPGPPTAGRGGFGNDRRLRFTPNLQGTQLDLLKDLTLSFTTPLRSFDSTKISLATDSAFNRTPFTAALDSTRKLLTISTRWRENTLYNLILDRDFAEDTAGRRLLKADTLSFTTKRNAEYGRLQVRIRNADAQRNPVLLFVQNDQVVFSAPLRGGIFSSQLFLPGDYELRILYDANNNGRWDPGQFFGTKKQPEIVQPIEQKITVRPAWDNEFERSL